MARLYVDENLAGRFVSGLRDFGHDVVLGGDLGEGRTDAWHFGQAYTNQRILVTLDQGFEYFHRMWTTLRIMNVVQRGHAGILRAAQTDGFTQIDWLPVIHEKLALPDEISGRMYTWIHDRGEWLEDKWRPEA